jgi:hypothetical protein
MLKTINKNSDLFENISVLINEIEMLKLEIIKSTNVEYTSQDARMVALDSLQMDISVLGMWFSSFYSLKDNYTISGEFNKRLFLNSIRSNLPFDFTESSMINFLRMSFFTQIHFKIDNLFKNILSHINKLPKKSGYWNLTTEILRESELNFEGDDKIILTCLANLRNSLHGNGIHKTNSLEIILNKIKFNFTKDEIVNCSSWNHIFILLYHNIEILRKILLSRNVKNIKNTIIDNYANKNNKNGENSS